MQMSLSDAPPLAASDVVRAPSLAALTGVAHAFFTRAGGVSGGLYRGLNAGVGSHDQPDAVAENRRRAAGFLGVDAADLVTPWQVHSADAVLVDAPFPGERPRADAVVTARRGLAVGVVTADCGPVLFADAENGVVGAAHAGWGGAVKGVLEATVEAMEQAGARRGAIRAVLGPSISGTNYEVGDDRRAEILALTSADAARFFTPGQRPGKWQFDLPAYTLDRLALLGLADVTGTGRCTYADPDRFFSFRRTTHRGEPDYGRQLSAIALR